MIPLFLQKVAEIPPRMLFPLEIYKDYAISCFTGNTKICYNYLINSFEKFSQIELILERLKEAKHHLPEELTQTASYIKSVLDSKSLEDSGINKAEF